MSKLNPYAPIEKVPLFTEDRMQSGGYSVRLEDPAAEDGWQEVGLVSENYLLVPNEKVQEMAHRITERSPFSWEEETTYFDGRRYALAMRANGETQTEVQEGDLVGLGLLFENSYDGSTRLGARLFAYRLACTNGMLSKEHFTGVRFRHDPSSSKWTAEMESALRLLEEAPARLERFAEACQLLTRMRPGASELQAIRGNALSHLPVTVWGQVLDQFLLEEEHTGWGLLNAGANVLWHERGSHASFAQNEQLTSGLTRFALEAADEDGS